MCLSFLLTNYLFKKYITNFFTANNLASHSLSVSPQIVQTLQPRVRLCPSWPAHLWFCPGLGHVLMEVLPSPATWWSFRGWTKPSPATGLNSLTSVRTPRIRSALVSTCRDSIASEYEPVTQRESVIPARSRTALRWTPQVDRCPTLKPLEVTVLFLMFL